uniref:Uncharacterized protein n=1 Tax=Lepeophtheirus salmonis TaxID=72036 RepID=A0A0K2TV97_LEPSM
MANSMGPLRASEAGGVMYPPLKLSSSIAQSECIMEHLMGFSSS